MTGKVGTAANESGFDDTLQQIRSAILLVTENDDVRGMLQGLLEQNDYVVFSASTGFEALLTLGRMPRPSLALLDLRMSGMSGLDVIHVMRAEEDYASIPVILMTSFECSAPPNGVRVLRTPFGNGHLLALVFEAFLSPPT